MKALIVGKGRIGHAIQNQLLEKGSSGVFFDAHRNLDQFKAEIPHYDVVMLAISTKDGGESAYDYILPCLDRDIPIVTAEKGALAYYFEELLPALNLIGCNATVGGASGIPSLISSHKGHIMGMKGIVNATINFILWARQSGMSEEGALFEAQRKGLCEQKSGIDIDEICASEVEDALMKASIMFNLSGLGKPISPHSFCKIFCRTGIRDLLNDRQKKRLIVEIRLLPDFERESFYADAFWHYQKPWLITGTFKIQAEKEFCLFPEIDISAENNTLIIERTDGGSAFVCGPGAGPVDVAERMIEDAKELLQHA